jgi:hypothetical protein
VEGRLPARRRLQRALEKLDPSRSDHAALLRDAQALAPAADDGEVDLLAWRAERLGMHALVLGTLPEAARGRLAGRRLFSVGIGGLDLGMRRVLAKAPRRGLEMRGGRKPAAAGRAPAPSPSAPETAAPASAGRFQGPMPAHGFAPAPESATCAAGFRDGTREVRFDAGCRVLAVLRQEGERALALRFDHDRAAWTARALPVATFRAAAVPEPDVVPDGLALMAVAPRPGETEDANVPVWLRANGQRLTAPLARRGLQRLLLGEALAPAGAATLPGLVPPPAELGSASAWMVWTGDLALRDVPGEEDPRRLAEALGATSVPTVLGVGTRAAERWAAAPRIARALLLAPADAFPGASAGLRRDVERAWGKGPIAESLPSRKLPDLVVLASAEAPAVLAERALALASDPRLAGRHLAVLSLSGALPATLAVDLLDRGAAGVALSADSAAALGVLATALASAGKGVRAETLPGLGVWTYGISASRPPTDPRDPGPRSSPSPRRARR